MMPLSWCYSLVLGMGCREMSVTRRRHWRSRGRDLLFKFQRHAPRELKQLLDRRDLRFEMLPAGRIVYFHYKEAGLPGGDIEQQNRTIDVLLARLALIGERHCCRASREICNWLMH